MAVPNPPIEMLKGFPMPPSYDDPAEQRQYLKTKLAGAFRIFGKFGFSEGVAGHITVRDPEHTDSFWVNPFGMSFNEIKASDLIRVDHNGSVVEGDHPVNRAAFAIHSRVHAAVHDSLKLLLSCLLRLLQSYLPH